MAVRVGINGFGRIGRSFTRALLARGDDAGVELVAVNDPMGDSHTVAFLLKHDSVGRHAAPTTSRPPTTGFSIDGREIQKLEVMDPAEIPWSDHGVDVVIESTGLFTAREKAAGHLGGSVGRVVISAPSGDADATICMGVNDEVYDPSAAHGDLERVVHHQLPRADGEGAQRHLRARAGPHDDGARVHERPVAAGPRQGDAQRQARPAPHARRRPLDHPEQHRRGEGHRPRAARARGQAERHLAARPGAHRFDHRPVGDARPARSPSTRSTPRSTPPATTSRTAACSSTRTSRWCRPTSSATRRRASSPPRTP